MALNGMKLGMLASESVSLWWVLGDPPSSYSQSTDYVLGDASYKVKFQCTPGEWWLYPDTIDITCWLEVWLTDDWLGTHKNSDPIHLNASVDQDGIFVADLTPLVPASIPALAGHAITAEYVERIEPGADDTERFKTTVHCVIDFSSFSTSASDAVATGTITITVNVYKQERMGFDIETLSWFWSGWTLQSSTSDSKPVEMSAEAINEVG